MTAKAGKKEVPKPEKEVPNCPIAQLPHCALRRDGLEDVVDRLLQAATEAFAQLLEVLLLGRRKPEPSALGENKKATARRQKGQAFLPIRPSAWNNDGKPTKTNERSHFPFTKPTKKGTYERNAKEPTRGLHSGHEGRRATATFMFQFWNPWFSLSCIHSSSLPI